LHGYQGQIHKIRIVLLKLKSSVGKAVKWQLLE